MRKLIKVILAQPSSDGDGVKINRIAGQNLNAIMDPFLLLDEIKSDEASDYLGGFPEHPHRGFETITYMKVGRMRHRDSLGNEGVIESGDLQWMTAGRGVLHSEMPEQSQGLLHGFQIWLNLPAAEKMKPAAYREILSDTIPEQAFEHGGKMQVIAGEVAYKGQMTTGALTMLTPAPMSTEPLFLDIELHSNESIELKFKPEQSPLVYVYQGATTELETQQMGLYSEGETLKLSTSNSNASLLILSGKALHEPIVQYGPFVMNTRQQIEQAFDDYRNNKLL